MAVEEARRIALHRAAAESWGEEVADTLTELVAPSGHELATRQDIEGILVAMNAMDERWDERLSAMEQRWDERLGAMDERLDAMEQRWDERLGAMEWRWDERLGATNQRIDAMERHWDVRLTDVDRRWATESRALRAELVGEFQHGLNQAITRQTRGLVISLMVTVAAISGVAFGVG